MPAGRPTKYRPEFADQAAKLCKLGATVEDVADFLGVERTTLWRWSCRHEDFCNALKVGKAPADDRVEQSLYRRATGYTYEAEKVMGVDEAGNPIIVKHLVHVPPDSTAMIYWLNNRRPNDWRGKRDPQQESGDGESDERIREREQRADAFADAVIRLAARERAGEVDGGSDG